MSENDQVISYVAITLLTSYYIASIAGCGVHESDNHLPAHFPCQWVNGEIPFVFDFFAIHTNHLFEMIRQAHQKIEEKSCLTFQERNPVKLAKYPTQFHYLYYTYSNALEDCCAAIISPNIGRRVVLITPSCKAPHEIAHVTLHMLGLSHKHGEAFSPPAVSAVLHPNSCNPFYNELDRNFTLSSEEQSSYSEDLE